MWYGMGSVDSDLRGEPMNCELCELSACREIPRVYEIEVHHVELSEDVVCPCDMPRYV